MGLFDTLSEAFSGDDDGGGPDLPRLLDELAQAIEYVAARRSPEPFTRRAVRLARLSGGTALEVFFDELPWELRRKTGRQHAELAAILERVAQHGDDGEIDQLVLLHGEVVRAQLLVAELQFEGEEASELRGWGRKALILVVAAVTGLAGFWVRGDRGLHLESVAMIEPAGVYQGLSSVDSDDVHVVHREEWLREYMEEFSLEYFGRENRWNRMQRLDPPFSSEVHVPLFELQSVLRNESHGETLLISHVEAIVVATAAAVFPWARLDVTTDVTWNLDTETLDGSSLGTDSLGPAIDLAYRVQDLGSVRFGVTGDVVSSRVFYRSEVFPLRSTREQQTDGPDPDRAALLELPAAADGRLVDPFFLRLAEAPAEPGPQHIEVPAFDGRVDGVGEHQREYDVGWFERIETEQRLAEVTAVQQGGAVIVQARWRSLKDERREEAFERPLAADRLYLDPADELLEFDPAPLEYDSGYADNDRDGIPDVADGFPGSIVELLAGEDALAELEGEQLVLVQLRVDARPLVLGASVSDAAAPNEFLAPQGALVIRLKVDGPHAFRHTIQLRVSGDTLSTVSFDVHIPEWTGFDQEGREAAVERLLGVFGSPQTVEWGL